MAYGIYWLWQRQPKPKNHQPDSVVGQEQNGAKREQSLEIKPQDSQVLTDSPIKIEGQSKPDQYLAVYSNGFNYLIQTDNSGKFEQAINLTEGLNLIEIVAFSRDLKEDDKITLTYWLTKKDKKTMLGSTVFAGSVKTIFENILTLSTPAGEKNIRTLKTTEIVIPTEDETEIESTKSALDGVRVGDYLIALGNLSQDTLNAKRLEIIRQNKPQVTKKLVTAKILTQVRQNLFSGRDLKESKIQEFTLTKDSQILIGGQKAESEDIAKNKEAFIFFTTGGGKKIVDLIYQLP